MKLIMENGITALIADNQFRKRDVRFESAQEHKSYTERMKAVFDTPESRSIYSKRMGTAEPVFSNLRSTLRLDRFTRRSKKKVNIQWVLYCIVHNIGKIQRYAEA